MLQCQSFSFKMFVFKARIIKTASQGGNFAHNSIMSCVSCDSCVTERSKMLSGSVVALQNARLRAQLEAATAAQQGSTSGVTTNRPRVSAFAAFPAPEAEDFEGSVVEPSRPKKSQMHVPHTPTTAAYHLPTKFDPCIPGGF